MRNPFRGRRRALTLFLFLGCLGIYFGLLRGAAKKTYTYLYPRPALAIDVVIVAKPEKKGEPAKVLLVKRNIQPFKGMWALPGGFVEKDEPLQQAAARELKEETRIDASKQDILLTQVYTFGDPGRVPNNWCVSVVYAAVVPSTELSVAAGDDAADAQWHDVATMPKQLGFDHVEMVKAAFRHLAKEDEVKKGGLSEQLVKAAGSLEATKQ